MIYICLAIMAVATALPWPWCPIVIAFTGLGSIVHTYYVIRPQVIVPPAPEMTAAESLIAKHGITKSQNSKK